MSKENFIDGAIVGSAVTMAAILLLAPKTSSEHNTTPIEEQGITQAHPDFIPPDLLDLFPEDEELPPHIEEDTYGNGVRFTRFILKDLVVQDTAIQSCDGNTLVTTWSKVSKLKPPKNGYYHRNQIKTEKNSEACDDIYLDELDGLPTPKPLGSKKSSPNMPVPTPPNTPTTPQAPETPIDLIPGGSA